MNTLKGKIYLILFLYIISNIKCEGIFDSVKERAEQIFNKMTQEQRIGSLFIEKYPETIQKKKEGANPSGFLLNEKFFEKPNFEQLIHNIQDGEEIKYAIAVEEEGGEMSPVGKVVRKEGFKSPMESLFQGGQIGTVEEEETKLHFLKEHGINMNLGPIADVCENKTSFLYGRTLGLNVEKTKEYIDALFEEFVEHKFTACIKHYPGYGDNKEDILAEHVDYRNETINENLEPFEVAIEKGAPMIFVSNLIIEHFEPVPVSISDKWHQKIFTNFTGLILADFPINETKYELAVNLGYEMMLTENFEESVKTVKSLIEGGKINEEKLNETVKRIISWRILYISHEDEEEEKKSYTLVVVLSGILSFALITVIAFLVYKFWLSKHEEEEEPGKGVNIQESPNVSGQKLIE